MSCGYSHTCVVLENGRVKCWGGNLHGKLGLGDTINRGRSERDMGDNLPFVNLGNMKVTRISTSPGHTCAHLENNVVKCWGDNFYGQLGLNDMEDRGDSPSEIEELRVINLGIGTLSIMAGGGFSCAVLTNGEVKCWGKNDISGNLGTLWCTDYDNRTGICGGEYSRLLQGYGFLQDQMGNSLPSVKLGEEKVLALSLGTTHVCALFSNTNKLKCWGNNEYGQLGLNDTINRGYAENQMGENLPWLSLNNVIQVSTFNNHTCALIKVEESIKAKCWGYNYYGQLGLGNKNNLGDGVSEIENSSFIDY